MQIEDLSPGMRVMLDDDTPGIVLGPGGFRSEQDSDPDWRLVFHPISGYVIAWWYKAEWHLAHLDKMSGWPIENWKKEWSDKAKSAILNRRKYY